MYKYIDKITLSEDDKIRQDKRQSLTVLVGKTFGTIEKLDNCHQSSIIKALKELKVIIEEEIGEHDFVIKQ